MRLGLLVLLAGLPLASIAPAQDDLASKIINDPSAPNVNGDGKAKLIDDAGVQGGKALQVTVRKKGDHNWDSTVESPIKKPVKAGDKLVLAFQAKLESGEGGATTATLPYNAIQIKAAPYTAVVGGQATIGPTWALQKIEGKADKDYGPDELKASIQIGNAKQTIDFGPIMVFDMGQ